MASNIEEVVTPRQVKEAEVVGIVGKKDGSNFASADVEKVGDVFGSGSGVAKDMLGLS